MQSVDTTTILFLALLGYVAYKEWLYHKLLSRLNQPLKDQPVAEVPESERNSLPQEEMMDLDDVDVKNVKIK